MGEIVKFETPSGGSSSIVVNTKGNQVDLILRREMGDGQVVTETFARMSRSQAAITGAALVKAGRGHNL